MNEKSNWISMVEVAHLLHLSRPTARAKLASGEIPGLVAHFGTARVSREVFEKWLAAVSKPRKAV